jgi:tRNA threonylcarbamoyladenosine biosynthesis protein TsaB
MAANVSHMGKSICAVMDARCNQVYNALFDVSGGSLHRVCPDRAVSLSELKKELVASKKSYILVGDGCDLCYNDMKKDGLSVEPAPAQLRFQNAWGVALVSAQAAARGETVAAEALNPVYLRLSQAERERLKNGGALRNVPRPE